jgi:small subunit ribosomal protein S7
MSRRHRAPKRDILPDPKFGDLIVSKFINNIMLDGKKFVAERIVYGAFDIIRTKEKLSNDNDVVTYFHEGLDKVKPQLEVKSRRVGGATYQVPIEVRGDRAQALSMRWIIDAARKRNEDTMMARLANELIDAHNDRGSASKKRDDTHKMAEANKAFAHYRF